MLPCVHWRAELTRTWRGITNLRPSTRLRDDATFHNHIAPTFGAVPLARVDRTSLREWVAGLSDPDGSALAPATTIKAVQVFNKLMRAALEYPPSSTAAK